MPRFKFALTLHWIRHWICPLFLAAPRRPYWIRFSSLCFWLRQCQLQIKQFSKGLLAAFWFRQLNVWLSARFIKINDDERWSCFSPSHPRPMSGLCLSTCSTVRLVNWLLSSPVLFHFPPRPRPLNKRQKRRSDGWAKWKLKQFILLGHLHAYLIITKHKRSSGQRLDLFSQIPCHWGVWLLNFPNFDMFMFEILKWNLKRRYTLIFLFC